MYYFLRISLAGGTIIIACPKLPLYLYKNQNSLDIKTNLRVFDVPLMKLCFDIRITWGRLKRVTLYCLMFMPHRCFVEM